MLGIEFVPEFEISYKLFSMAELIPLVFSATLFPVLIKKINDRSEDLLNYYRLLFRLYLFYGFISFLFIYIFASDLLPFLFGRQYQSTAMYCKELFFTMLLFPTSLLQANLIIATGYEQLDMKFNFVLLFMLVLTSLYFLQIYHSLSALNVSIFISFLLFHILQDIHLFRKRYMKLSDILFFYLYLLIVVYFFYTF
jgi:O-antigen/teichoic acid export membrane protein